MHPDLENLINMALADGEVTEKEREIIFRKADKLGEDRDEVEMILDGRIALMKKDQIASQTQPQISKSNKEGDLKKCPSCGAPVESFKTKCADCGHEFRNIEANSSINSLFQILQKIEQDERSKPRQKSLTSLLGGGDETIFLTICNSQANAISSFPVPNSKEDILEFLAMALPQTKIKLQKYMFMTAPIDRPKEALKNAWISKCQQVIMKASLAMKDDKKTLEEINNYAKQLGIK